MNYERNKCTSTSVYVNFKPTFIMFTLFNLNLICLVYCFNLVQLDYISCFRYMNCIIYVPHAPEFNKLFDLTFDLAPGIGLNDNFITQPPPPPSEQFSCNPPPPPPPPLHTHTLHLDKYPHDVYPWPNCDHLEK